MANNPFGKAAMEELKQAKKEREEKKVVIGDQKIRLVPSKPIWKILGALSGCSFGGSLLLYLLGSGAYRLFSRTTVIGLLEGIKRILEPINGMTLLVGLVSGVLLLFVWLVGLRPPHFDNWVKDIAKKRLSTDYIWYDRHYIYVHYDVSLQQKDIEEFVREISNKSELFTYYLDNVDINSYSVAINIAKKKPIPKRCTIDISKDTVWNFVPLGLAVNDELKDVTPIGWYLNNEEKAEGVVQTLPSTSMLIAGGTGSGKSVVENGIIGHISRHADQIQGFLADVKRVEFGPLKGVSGIHKIATDVEAVGEVLEQLQRLMMTRFAFMEENGVQNIYDLKGREVAWFEIGRKTLQFDEILQCTINGKPQLATVETIYEAVQRGDEVDVDPLVLVE